MNLPAIAAVYDRRLLLLMPSALTERRHRTEKR
jgi:hypothetical protein